MTDGADRALPEAADRRLSSAAFSSGLSVPDFAACLDMGLEPVDLVQGFCAMQWGWYGTGSPYMRGAGLYAPAAPDTYADRFGCPHGFVSAEHRMWGQNYEQPWIESAWRQGFTTAYERMVLEAGTLGAHGVVGVVDTVQQLAEADITEFHFLGTAVVVSEGPAPVGGRPWTTYLAGQRLAKLFEAGFMPIAICASLSSVRVWANCVTEYLMEGGAFGASMYPNQEIEQVVRAHMAARSLVRGRVRADLAGDVLHGADMVFNARDIGAGDGVIECRLSGTRVRRFKEYDPLPPPVPTVSLS